MGYFDCPCCGKSRKVGDFITPDGEHVSVCANCGDPEYYEPIEDSP